MPASVTLYRVFLACPSDIVEERGVVEDILREWNLHHGDDAKSRVELVSWQTHAFPDTGDRPQGIINKQAFDKADVVVAFFWSKFGSPTGEADSGTVEEIKRGIALKKPVMVYFSKQPLKTSPRRGEMTKIDRFKEAFGKEALFWEYSDLEILGRAFRTHFAHVMSEVLKKQRKRR